MKIIFFGSGKFAVPSLERLLNSKHKVLSVITQPDREKGRHLVLSPTAVKELAVSKNIDVYQPEDLMDPEFLKKLKLFSADIFIVVDFGKLLPREVFAMPKLYTINLHPSLLPKYRGAAPVNWAVIKGEKKTGLTVIRINDKLDAGDRMLQRSIIIEKNDTSIILEKKLAPLGALLLLDALRIIEEGRATFKRQPDKKGISAPKLKKEDGLINWQKSADEIHNLIRGTVPWPGAYTFFDKKKINIWKAHTTSGKANPGEVISVEKELLVGTKNGMLRIEEIQLEGKKRMSVSEFLRGFTQITKGTLLGT